MDASAMNQKFAWVPKGVQVVPLPPDLVLEVNRSLRTPQFGPHHNEGPFMVHHLMAIMDILQDVFLRKRFHEKVPNEIRHFILKEASSHIDKLLLYVFLHDIDKPDCMTFVYKDGRKESVTWRQWAAMVDSHRLGRFVYQGHFNHGGDDRQQALGNFLDDLGVKSISYYQKREEGKGRLKVVAHGRSAANRLRRRRDIPELVIKAIETHEVAYQFDQKGGINLKTFRKLFVDWTKDEIAFMLLVNYADMMGSLGRDMRPKIDGFLWLARTYLAVETAKDVLAIARENFTQVDQAALDKELERLYRQGSDDFTFLVDPQRIYEKTVQR